MLINPTSVTIFNYRGWKIVLTGGWHDVYFNGQHRYGSINLIDALNYCA